MKPVRGLACGMLAGLLTGCAHLPLLGLPHDTLSAQEHVTLANAYLANKETNLAVQQYQEALEKDTHNLTALVGLGNIAYDNKDWKHAEKYFRKALKSFPGNPGAANNLAMTYLAEGKHLDKAMRLVNDALPNAGALAPYLLDTRQKVAQAGAKF